MAILAVTKDTPVVAVANVNRDMDVVFDCTGSVTTYVRTTRAGVIVSEWKVRFDAVLTISFLKNDVVQAIAVGTGTIQVTIL